MRPANRASMYCQVCGTRQRDDAEYCSRCHHKLLVISALSEAESAEFESGSDDGFSFDEHLLERISVLEEVLKRTADSVRQLLSVVGRQERNLVVQHTGLLALADSLTESGTLSAESWTERWETEIDRQLLALDRREDLARNNGRILALHRGEPGDGFHQRLERAEGALLGGDLRRAGTILEEAWEDDRSNYELAYFIAESFFTLGEVDKALRYFDRVLRVKPDHDRALLYSGILHFEGGNSRPALLALERAATLRPGAFLPHFGLGALHAGEARLREAVAALELAVAIEPEPRAYFLLGSCQHDLGRRGKAMAALERAVQADPAYAEAYQRLAGVYLDRGWRRKALDTLRMAQRLNRRSTLSSSFMRCLSQSASVSLPPVDEEVSSWLERGQRQLKHGESRVALASYRRAAGLAPENATVLLAYVLACLELGQHAEGETATRRLLELTANEGVRATAYAALIEALRGEGRLQEGNRFCSRLLDEGETDFARSIAYYEMAYNLADRGDDLDRALDCASRSLAIVPRELEHFSLAAKGWVHFLRDEFDQAVDCLSRSTAGDESASTRMQLGMALLASGDATRARQALTEARQLDGRPVRMTRHVLHLVRDGAGSASAAREG